MKRLNYLKIITILLFCNFYNFGQNIIVTTDDGKKVVLKPDKTWEYAETKQQEYQQIQVITDKRYVELPEHYRNFLKFFSAFESEFKKDEFEKESDYKNRISKIASEKLYLGVPINQLVFIVNPRIYYDPEIEEFSISFNRVSMIMFEPHNIGDFYFSSFSFKLKIPPAEAKLLKSNLKIGMTGIPINLSSYSDSIHFTIMAQEIYVFDSLSGKIYESSRVKLNH